MSVNVTAIISRSKEFNAINKRIEESKLILASAVDSNTGLVDSNLCSKALSLADKATADLKAYYKRHPNCLSKGLTPWLM